MEGPKGVGRKERASSNPFCGNEKQTKSREATGESEMPGAIWRAALALALLAPAAALYATDTASLIPARQSPSQVLLPPPASPHLPLLSPVPELTDPRPATRAALEQLRLRGGSDVDAGPLPTPDSKRLKDMAKCSGYACSSLYALSALPPRRRLRVRSSCARMPHPRARACRHGSKHARDPACQCAKHGYTHGFAHTACSPPRTRTHAPHADMQEAHGRASDRRGPD